MYRMRRWSVRNARWLKRLYAGFEATLVLLDPLLRRIGYERLDKPFATVEKMTKGVLLDSQNCGQCIVGFTGLSCPMNCPKRLRNGPCGGVRPGGGCEVRPDMPCVWVLAWEGNNRSCPAIRCRSALVTPRRDGSSACCELALSR